jgi:acetyl-CoA acetyltransferase
MTGAVALSAVPTPTRRYGVATMCVGVGQGQAARFEV